MTFLQLDRGKSRCGKGAMRLLDAQKYYGGDVHSLNAEDGEDGKEVKAS